MAKTKYGQYILPAEVKTVRKGEPPLLSFSATPYGIDAGWGILVATQVYDEETRKRLYENPHSHDFHQFITYFGSNPYNIAEFDAEISICLGEEREEHIINKPTVIHFPPGMIHGYGKTPHVVNKPVYHLDLSFAPTYVRKDLPE
jgi:hypothetical protein